MPLVMCKTKQDGFTLIETTVALIIVIMLISLGATLYNNYMATQKIKSAAREIRMVGIAYQSYLNANRDSIIDKCKSGGLGDVGVIHINQLVTQGQQGVCYFSVSGGGLIGGLGEFMPDGLYPPRLSPYGQPYEGRGQVTVDFLKSQNPEISPLLFIGDLLNPSSAQAKRLDILTASKIIHALKGYAGFSYEKHHQVVLAGNGLFDINKIKLISQVQTPSFPVGYLFYRYDDQGSLTEPVADDRYLFRDKVNGGAEYNTMQAPLRMNNQNVNTESGIKFNPSSVEEGHPCEQSQGGLVQRDKQGHMLQCHKLSLNIYANSQQGVISQNIQNERPTTLLYPAGSYEWQYIFSETVQSAGIYLYDADQLDKPLHIPVDRTTPRWPAIRVPYWYPYGHVEVCLLRSHDKSSWYNFIFSYPQQPLQEQATILGYLDSDNIPSPECYQLRRGQVLALRSPTVFGAFIHYKGHVLPNFFTEYVNHSTEPCGEDFSLQEPTQ